MGLINLGAGLSAMGGVIAEQAGHLALEQQKSDLERQAIMLSSQLAGEREHAARAETGALAEGQAKNLSLIPQAASIDAYLRATGHSGGLADFGYRMPGGSTPPTSSSPAPTQADTAPAMGNDGMPTSASAGAASPQAINGSTFPQGAPVVTPIGGKGKVLGIPLPPGWTAQMAAVAGPDALSKAWAEWSKPGNIRPGSAIPYFNFSTGKMETLFQQPNTPEGYLYDQTSNSYVKINNADEAISGTEAAKSSGSSQGALPAKLSEITATGNQARTTEGFKAGLEAATTLVPSYDPVTQTTRMVPKAEALKAAQSGTGIQAPPMGGEAPASDTGFQKDGSFKMPDGSAIPPVPKAVKQPGGGFQAAPSAADAATQSVYPEIIKGWAESVGPAVQAEQRFHAMAEALKAMQSGQWASAKATIGTHLIAAGLPKDLVTQVLGTDPAQAQIILKNNFSAALSTLSAARLGRITQNEIFALQKNLANPDLQPEANLAILAEGIGVARFQQSLAGGWNTARQLGYADPLVYEEKWMTANPIQKFVDQAKSEIGPLKGMSAGQEITAPSGNKYIIKER
jgi:hypothetical protein